MRLSLFPETNSVSKGAIVKPTITLTPKSISGWDGELIDVECISTGGNPVGRAELTYSLLKPISDLAIETTITEGKVSARFNLSRALDKDILVCTNTAHRDVVEETQPISVNYATYMYYRNRVFSGTIRRRSGGSSGCKYVRTNVEGERYSWEGDIVPEGQENYSRIYFQWNPAILGNYQYFNCTATVAGDPYKRNFTFHYLYTYTGSRSRMESEVDTADQQNSEELRLISSVKYLIIMCMIGIILSQF